MILKYTNFLIIILIVLVNTIYCTIDKIRYDNYRIYKVIPENDKHITILNSLLNEYEFWKDPTHINEFCIVLVNPEQLEEFQILMKNNEIKLEETISDVQKLIDETSPNQFTKSGLEWENYHSLKEIYSWVDDLSNRFPDVVTVFDLPGNSYEGRPIRALKISYKENNPGIFIEANMHAREWISSATATWIINELLTSGNGTIRLIAENIDWYFVPVLNPDGLVYTHEKNRMWRKTRQPHGECIGADINRNFDFLWLAAGASTNPCSETFAGPKPASEPEVQALVKYFESEIPENKIKIYISFHSFGQMALTPWGHTNKEFPDNYEDMLKVGSGFANAAKRLYGSNYRYGASSVVLYNVSGSSKEWAYGVHKVPFTFTIELRDTGKYGFILPPNQIIPTAEEVLDGLIGMINAVPKEQLIL